MHIDIRNALTKNDEEVNSYKRTLPILWLLPSFSLLSWAPSAFNSQTSSESASTTRSLPDPIKSRDPLPCSLTIPTQIVPIPLSGAMGSSTGSPRYQLIGTYRQPSSNPTSAVILASHGGTYKIPIGSVSKDSLIFNHRTMFLT